MHNTQIRKYPDHIRGPLGLILLGFLMSVGPTASARVEQEFYPTRHAATLAARRMGGQTAIVYDKDMGEYVVTLIDGPHARHIHRRHPIHRRHH